MNKIERAVDGLDPGLSVRLRALKMRLQRNVLPRLIRDMVRPGDVAVDVGANRGICTHIMSKQVGSRGQVHAVEPFPANGERLQTLARRRGNITLHRVALSDHSGSGLLRVPVHDGHPIDALASLEGTAMPNEDTCAVVVRTLDELLLGERRVSFLKCDVEGHEHRVLQGGAGVLRRDHPVILTEVEQRHREDPIANTFAFFADAGYRAWFVGRSGLRPLEEFDVARDQLRYLDGQFMPYSMPQGYVNDFLFCPDGILPPPWSLAGLDRVAA